MRARILSALALTLLFPVAGWAGAAQANNIPTLGEYGLIALGVALAGTGIGVLRGRKRR